MSTELNIRNGSTIGTRAEYNQWITAGNSLKTGEFVFLFDEDVLIIGNNSERVITIDDVDITLNEIEIGESLYLKWKSLGNTGSISDFISLITSSVDNSVKLVTSPVVDGVLTASNGSSITLTASGSVSAFNGVLVSKYTWIKPDGTKQIGNSINFTLKGLPGASNVYKVFATDSLGNVSAETTHTIIVSANRAPSASGVTSNLPANVTRGSSYTVTLANGSDPDGSALTYIATSPIGCTISTISYNQLSVTVNSDATVVSFVIKVRDPEGLESSNNVTITRTGGNILQPTGTSGTKSEGVHNIIIPVGVSSIVITGKATIITGAISYEFIGNTIVSVVKSLNPNASNALTLTVSAGGSCVVNW